MKERDGGKKGYGNGDEVVGEVHEEVNGGPEVEGIVGRGRALTLNKHGKTHIEPAVLLIPSAHVVTVQHSLGSMDSSGRTM